MLYRKKWLSDQVNNLIRQHNVVINYHGLTPTGYMTSPVMCIPVKSMPVCTLHYDYVDQTSKFETREIRAKSYLYDNIEDFIEPICDWYLLEVVYNAYHGVYKIRYAVDDKSI